MFAKRIISVLAITLASCTGGSSASDQNRGGSGAPAVGLVDRAHWPQLNPFYVFDCSANVDTAAGHFEFLRSYSPDGSLGSVHATWSLGTAIPRIEAVFNTENGRDFDLGSGSATVEWEFVPALRPTSIRSRLRIGDLPFTPDPRRGPVPGMISALAGSNSAAMSMLAWRDFTGAARDGAVTIRVEVTGAPHGWNSRSSPGYLGNIRAVGDDALETAINTATLAAVERQLLRMAAETAVPRPEDVPSRCTKVDQLSLE